MAAGADLLVPHLYLEWRQRRSDEIELSDGANKLAKRSVFEKAVHDQHCREVGKGQAKQKTFPQQSRTSTSTPRKWSQLRVVARFFGASDGPNSPSKITTALMMRSGD